MQLDGIPLEMYELFFMLLKVTNLLKLEARPIK
jgi:hypothetical protein